MKWVTFTGADPAVDVTVGYYQPWGLVSLDPGYRPIYFLCTSDHHIPPREREPFELAQRLWSPKLT